MLGESKNRVEFIDVAKGLGIIFIVLGHVCKAGTHSVLRIFCYSFNAQLFFFLSGLTFLGLGINCVESAKQPNGLKQVKKWVSRILVPYFIWGFISILIYCGLGVITKSTEDSLSFGKNIMALLYGNSNSDYFQWNRPLWFLPCIFIVYLLWYVVLRIIANLGKDAKRNQYILIMITIISYVFTIVLARMDFAIRLPFSTEVAIYMFPLFGFGLVIKNTLVRRGDITHHNYTRFRLAILSLLLFTIAITLGAATIRTGLRQVIFNGYLRFSAVTILECIAILLLAKLMEKNKILRYMGKRTLPILLMHKFPILFFQALVPFTKNFFEGEFAYRTVAEITLTVVSIFMCLLVDRFIIKFCPIMHGDIHLEKNK